MDPSKRLAYLFYRYYEKRCTQQEKDELFALLLEAEHDATLKHLIGQTLADDLPACLQDGETADKIIGHILGRQAPVIRLSPTRPNAKRIRRIRTLIAGAAAVFLILAVRPFLAYFHFHHAPQAPALAGNTPRPPADQCITLSDGSKVLLHKDAHINFDPPFNGKTREVYLSGEAYFDIRSDKRPFIVHTGNIKTIVLGTAFDINARDRDFTITVTRGKVRVENGESDFSILRRNEQATVDRVHNKLKKTKVDAGEVIAWKKPYLLFNDVSMKEAALELEQRFHVSIQFTNSASEACPVTASFTEGEPLEKIIRVLSKINNMDYKITNGTVIELTGEGCK